jgi:hypothetical protein
MGTMQASDYLENKLVDHIFRAAAFPKPTGLFIALFTAAPTDAGGGTEISGGGYARVALAPSDANWRATQGGTSGVSSGATGQTANAIAITFPAPSADWGTATHFGIYDAATGGNLLIWDALTAPRPIGNGDTPPAFPVGALAIQIN